MVVNFDGIKFHHNTFGWAALLLSLSLSLSLSLPRTTINFNSTFTLQLDIVFPLLPREHSILVGIEFSTSHFLVKSSFQSTFCHVSIVYNVLPVFRVTLPFSPLFIFHVYLSFTMYHTFRSMFFFLFYSCVSVSLYRPSFSLFSFLSRWVKCLPQYIPTRVDVRDAISLLNSSEK